MVKIESLKFKYEAQQARHIINIPLWEIDKQENIFISGKSGTGKSTLINLISGLLQPSSGEISINDIKISELSAKQRNKFRADNIGLISQQFNLIPYLSVIENINLAHSFRSDQSQISNEDIAYLLSKLKLNSSILHKKSCELSIGQQQRVAIIRALVNKPQLLLADEPTSALDHDAKISFIETLKEMTKQNETTLLFISHDLSIMHHFKNVIDMEQINVN